MVLHPLQEVLSEVKLIESTAKSCCDSGLGPPGRASELFELKVARGEGLPVRLVVISSLETKPYAAHENEFDGIAKGRH